MSTSIKQALACAANLETASDSRQLDAELLLAHALGKNREHLYTWSDEELTATDLERYKSYMSRRAGGEPIAYIVGRKAFWDFELSVSPDVLIPRPETELLVERAIELGKQTGQQSLLVADLGTGSGAIAIALARAYPQWRITAVDISEHALAVASANAGELGVGEIEFIQGSWCDGLAENEYDMIIANPPYVEAGDVHLEQGDLPFEPSIALVADNSGLSDLQAIILNSRDKLKRDAWLLLEHGYNQFEALSAMPCEA